MPEETPTVFGPKATEQIAKTVREVSRRMMNPRGERGRWQFHGGEGSGSQRIWFTIISVECVSATEMILTVEPTYYTGGCTAAIPGEDSYGYVIVEDVCSILLYYTQTYLESGVTGSATYMYPRSGYCTPLWLLDSICGTPECA